jgi:hypothetical protein
VDAATGGGTNFSHALQAKVKKIIRNVLRRANQPKVDRQGFIRAKINRIAPGSTG